MPVLTSLQNPAVKLVRSLADKKHRKDRGLFVAEGHQVLERARQEGWEPTQVFSTKAPEDWGKAERFTVDQRVMAALSSQDNPLEELAVFRQRWVAAKPKGLWVALEDMRDPGNLGTIIRKDHACRATMGSIFGMPLVRMATTELMSLCKTWPGDVVGTHLAGKTSHRRAYAADTLLVMGSEGSGLSPALSKACKTLVRIPMPGKAESLNVAIATGIMLFEAVKS